MYELPTSIRINDEEWKIRNGGDFRMVLDCFSALMDTELTPQERVIASMIIFYERFNGVEDFQQDIEEFNEAYEQMTRFFNCGQDQVAGKTSYRLIDWDKDAPLIASAVNKVAGKEIRLEPYLHWWTFMGYYLAVGECPLSTIVGIRHKKVKGKKLEKHERQFVADNPQYFNSTTQVDQDLEDWVQKQWNG